jgi:hypothetical protein
MSFLEIPVRSDLPAYDFLIDLEGATYQLAFQYNLRRGGWTFGIRDSSGNDILVGIPIIVSTDLTSRFQAQGAPPGRFVAWDTSGNNLNPTDSDFGSRVLFLYQEAKSG